MGKTLKFFALLFLGLLAGCGGKPNAALPDLMGKTKAEVIDICFAHAPRVPDGKIKFAIIEAVTIGTYYKTAQQAKEAARLMNADKWEVFFLDVPSTGKTEYTEVTFEDGRVARARKSSYSER